MTLKPNFIRRAWASKGGAAIMAVIYSSTILTLSFLEVSYFDLPNYLGYLLVPGAIFVSVGGNGTSTILGVPFLALLTSLLIYMTIGYIFDWYYKPYK